MANRSVEKTQKNETIRLKWFSWKPGKSAEGFLLDGSNDVNTLHFAPKINKETIPYFLPNDDREMNRLDFQHYIMKYAMQRNYITPVNNPSRVLDVGCGTGRWGREFAIQFPRAKVFGVDIDASSTRASNTTPVNYSFLEGNILSELPFPSESFDFVHQRFLHMAIPTNAWKQVIQELVRNTKRGGWIELAESDLTIQRSGPITHMLNDWGHAIAHTHNIDPYTSMRIGNLLDQAQLKKIMAYRVDLPIGNWAGRLGTMVASDLLAFNVTIRHSMLEHFRIPVSQYESMTEAMREEWESNKSYFSVYVVCGQKQ